MNFRGRCGLLLSLCVLLPSGCGKGGSTPSTLSGTVTYNGALVKGGKISLHAKEGGVYHTTINQDGTYSISSLPAGEMAAAIDTESLNPQKKKPDYGGGQVGTQVQSPRPDDAPPETPKGEYTKIPTKYTDPKTSTLTFNLTKGKNIQDFKLTD